MNIHLPCKLMSSDIQTVKTAFFFGRDLPITRRLEMVSSVSKSQP